MDMAGSVESTFSALGVRASTQLGYNIRLRGMLGWRRALGDTTPTSTHAFAGSVPFTISGVPLAKNVAVLEAGVETRLRPTSSWEQPIRGSSGGRAEGSRFEGQSQRDVLTGPARPGFRRMMTATGFLPEPVW